MNIIDISMKLIIGFALLFAVTKMIGKTQINQITPFDFISALVMGELLGNAIYDQKVGIVYVLYTLVLWGLLMFLIEVLAQKIRKTRGLLEGNPAIIIRNGIIDYKILKKNKLNVNTLQELLREKDVFSVRDVEFAILESSGDLSVLKNSASLGITRDDLDLPVKPVNLAVTLISDGVVLWDNLESSGFNINWLREKVREEGYQDIDAIFFAEWLDGEGLFLQGYN